jgi:hypothetical protein
MSIIRRTVRARYALLPFWYTLFYEAELTGELASHVLCIREVIWKTIILNPSYCWMTHLIQRWNSSSEEITSNKYILKSQIGGYRGSFCYASSVLSEYRFTQSMKAFSREFFYVR